MKVGTQLLLHTVSFPHMDTEKDEFIGIKIIELKKDVPDMWREKKFHIGYKAEGENDHIYTCNWSSFPSDSLTPTWQWYDITEKRLVYDIMIGLTGPIEFKPIFIDKYDFINWCPEHRKIFYKDRGIGDGCFDCYIDKKYPDREKPKKYWNGWR